MILLFAFLFIFWGTCLYAGLTVPGWKWPTAAALRPGGGVSGRAMTAAYWFVWSGLYLTSAVATAQAILRLHWILQSQEEDPVLWSTILVGIPVMLYFTYCSFQNLEKERRGAQDEEF